MEAREAVYLLAIHLGHWSLCICPLHCYSTVSIYISHLEPLKVSTPSHIVQIHLHARNDTICKESEADLTIKCIVHVNDKQLEITTVR